MGTKPDKVNKKKKNEKPESSKGAQDNSVTNTFINKHGGKVITDPRFSSVHSDPRFKKAPKHQSKVEIDSRFNQMFTGKNFTSSSSRFDKRGKVKNESENPLRHYYKLEEEELKKKKKDRSHRHVEDEEDEEGSEESEKADVKKLVQGSSYSESSSEDEKLKSSDESESDENDESDGSDGTSSTSTDTDDEDDEIEYDDEPEEPEENIPMIEQETRRLAIVNMDWSHVRAVDLYVLMSSFLPKGGHILSVSVYPSEFGLKRMEEEAVKGPVGLFDSDEDKSDNDDEGDDEIDDDKLRVYEKSRLRYYYAVVDCDSSATADYLYKSCDGTEYERTSNVLDLRFIPDSMEFKHPPRDVATEAPTKYEAPNFHTQALQHSKIHLSWEDDEPQRSKILKRNFNPDQLDELEFKEFLASDDGDSDSNDDDNDTVDGLSAKKLDKKERFLALLQSGNNSDEDGAEDDKDMEVTFNTGLEDISKHVMEKKRDKKSETVWDAYLRKRSEKKKARKNRSKDSSEDDDSDSDLEAPEQPDDFFVEEPSAKSTKVGKSKRKDKREQEADKEQEASRAELELLLADDQGADNNLKGYNLKPKKAKGKKGKEVPAEDKLPALDMEDPRFSAIFTNSLFALDPTDPQFKRSAPYARQKAGKQRTDVGEEIMDRQMLPNEAPFSSKDIISKSDDKLQADASLKKEKKEEYEFASLLRSLKNKGQQFKVSSDDKRSKKVRSSGPNRLLTKKEKHEVSPLVSSVKRKAKDQEPPSDRLSKKDESLQSEGLTKKKKKR